MRAPSLIAPVSAGLAALLLLLASGCASAPAPPAPEEPAEDPFAVEADPLPEPAVPESAEPGEPDLTYGPPSTVVIEDSSAPQEEERSLVEAARAERERRRHSVEPVAVITDKTLPSYSDVELSIATKAPAGPAEEEPAVAPEIDEGAKAAEREKPEGEGEGGEAYWRSRVLEARLAWRESVDETERLQSRVAELRQRFYAEDDPFYRDSQIKPAWDRSLDRLVEARAQADAARLEVQRILEEGRRAGALPGWLREGIDYEPREEEEEDREHHPQEPPVLDEDGEEP